MSSLGDFWFASLVLAVAAIAIVAALIVTRVAAEVLRPSRCSNRAHVVRTFLGHADEGGGTRSTGSRKELLEVCVELIQMVRGSDRDEFINRATSLGVPALLRHKLDSGSSRVRVAAAEALSQFHDDKSIERLRAALDDRNSSVRLTAALSLAAAGRAPPVRTLIEKLGIGTSEKSRLTVSLFSDLALHAPDDIRSIISDEFVPPGAKAAAIEALSASGEYALVPQIATLVLESPTNSPELPRYLRALAAFGHPAAEPAVLHALNSENWEARAIAASAAGRIGLVSLADRLQALLADPEWWVRFRAGEALAGLGAPGVELLRDAATTNEEPARSAAESTLAERGLA